MKPRLGVVLDLRRAAEDAARREVGRLERERAEMVTARDRHEQALAASDGGASACAMRELLAAYLSSLRRAIAAESARIVAQDGRIAAARDALALAHRDVKAIEAIRARDRTAVERAAQRREARANDEHAARIRMEMMA